MGAGSEAGEGEMSDEGVCKPRRIHGDLFSDDDLVETMVRQGHRPACAATGGGMLWFCMCCGRYGVTRLDGLRKRCQGVPLPSGKVALARLSKGLHPVKKQGEALVMRGWRSIQGGGRARV